MTIDATPITVNSLRVDGTLQPTPPRALSRSRPTRRSRRPASSDNTAGAQTGHALNVGGNLTNDGTLDLSTSANVRRASPSRARRATFSGTGLTTDLHTLTINKGTSNANILEITTAALSVRAGHRRNSDAYLTITNGTLKISGSFVLAGRTFTAAAFDSCHRRVSAQQPELHVSGQNGSRPDRPWGNWHGTPGSAAILRISAGTFNIGTATGNSMGLATTPPSSSKVAPSTRPDVSASVSQPKLTYSQPAAPSRCARSATRRACSRASTSVRVSAPTSS